MPAKLMNRVARLARLLAPASKLGPALRRIAKLRQVWVCTSLATHKVCPLPDDLRQAMQRYMQAG
jgi:hypothetical protein